VVELNALPHCPGVTADARGRMTQAFTLLQRDRPAQAYAQLVVAGSDGLGEANKTIQDRLEIQLGILLRDSSAELTGRQLAHHIAAGSLLAKLVGGKPLDMLAAYGAGLHVARVLQQDFEYNTQDKSTWTKSWHALQDSGHTDPLRSSTELALVPQRAQAFQLLPREVAIEKFPELGGAYEAIDTVTRIAPKTPAGELVIQRARDQLLAGMRRGFLHPTHKHLAVPTIRASIKRHLEAEAPAASLTKTQNLPVKTTTPSPTRIPEAAPQNPKVARPRGVRR
jgi:hypothetical protein